MKDINDIRKGQFEKTAVDAQKKLEPKVNSPEFTVDMKLAMANARRMKDEAEKMKNGERVTMPNADKEAKDVRKPIFDFER